MKLLGKEAEILLALHRGEEFPVRAKHERDALHRLRERGLVKGAKLTEKGKEEAEWRLKTIDGVTDVYDLAPAGGYLADIRFVYEPVTPFSYAWDWCGLKGISIVETDPRRGAFYFKARDKRFWLEGKTLSSGELTFNLPSPEVVEAWSKGTRISRETSELWIMVRNYFRFFLDLKEEVYYDVYALTAFQSWLLPHKTFLNSVWFLAAKGAFGGGKTVGGEALVKVCRHGKIASPSVAWLGRSIERLQIVPFVDEFDIVAEKNPELARIARMSQRRGQTYDRCTESGTPQSWRVFTVWIMSVHGELEDALATRTIPVTTEETQDWSIPVLNTIKTRMAQSMYDELWMWFMDSVDQLTLVDYPGGAVGGSLLEVINLVNLDQLLHQQANPEGVDLKEAQKRVFDELTKSLSEEQLEQLSKLSGRNVEVAYHMFKLSNLLGVNLDESIAKAMEIKAEVEEERKEVGALGLLRDLLVKLYEQRRTHPNYWADSQEFMVSNKEVFAEFIPYLHKHETTGVTPHQFKGLLRELGFDRPTSRRKMKVFTWAEIEDGAWNRLLDKKEEKPVRLANVFTPKVARMLGVRVEMPEEAKQREGEPRGLGEKIKLVYDEARELAEDSVVSKLDVADALQNRIDRSEVLRLLEKLEEEGKLAKKDLEHYVVVGA